MRRNGRLHKLCCSSKKNTKKFTRLCVQCHLKQKISPLYYSHNSPIPPHRLDRSCFFFSVFFGVCFSIVKPIKKMTDEKNTQSRLGSPWRREMIESVVAYCSVCGGRRWQQTTDIRGKVRLPRNRRQETEKGCKTRTRDDELLLIFLFWVKKWRERKKRNTKKYRELSSDSIRHHRYVVMRKL